MATQNVKENGQCKFIIPSCYIFTLDLKCREKSNTATKNVFKVQDHPNTSVLTQRRSLKYQTICTLLKISMFMLLLTVTDMKVSVHFNKRVLKNFIILCLDTSMPDTVILKNEGHLIRRLLGFLDNRKTPLKLCYRASVHGWSGENFHQHCDDKAGTVVLVKVGNYIFGGYTDQTWQGKNFTDFCP